MDFEDDHFVYRVFLSNNQWNWHPYKVTKIGKNWYLNRIFLRLEAEVDLWLSEDILNSSSNVKRAEWST